MKNNFFLSAALLFFSNVVFGQFNFGVSSGLSFNGAHFGYKINKNFIPFIGLQFANASVNYNESGFEFDNFDNLVSYENKTDINGGIYVPNLGCKYFLSQKNKLKTYAIINFAKPILKVKPNTGDNDFDAEIKDAVKKIKIWGGEAGFGTEYFFDDNFSIGGEFGIRHFNVKFNDSYKRTLTDPNTSDPVEVDIKTDIKTRINPTYTRFSLNFYF